MSVEALAARSPHGTPAAAAVAEFVGSAALMALLVVASALASMRSADEGVRLAEIAGVGAVSMLVLIYVLGPVSGAHFNPVVTMTAAFFGAITWRTLARYAPAQIVGALVGAVGSSLVVGEPSAGFGVPPVTAGRLVLETAATAGLVVLLVTVARLVGVPSGLVALVGYVAVVIWLSGMAGCANPAFTIAQWVVGPRSAPAALSTLMVFTAQFVGGTVIGLSAARFLHPTLTADQAAGLVLRTAVAARAGDAVGSQPSGT